MQPTDQDLQLLSEHDTLTEKMYFTPQLMSNVEVLRLAHLQANVIPDIYKKLGM